MEVGQDQRVGEKRQGKSKIKKGATGEDCTPVSPLRGMEEELDRELDEGELSPDIQDKIKAPRSGGGSSRKKLFSSII